MNRDTATANDDAQRTLERKALRNVRGLVDKLESQEREGARATLRFVVGSVIAAIIIGAVALAIVAGNKKQHPPVVSSPKAQVPASPAR